MSRLILSSNLNIITYDKIVNQYYKKFTNDCDYVLEFIDSFRKGIRVSTRKSLGRKVYRYSISVVSNIDQFSIDFIKELFRSKVVIIVHGGNTYDISMNLHRNGWFFLIKVLMERYNAVYIGYSAGAIMATPDINTAQWADIKSKDLKEEEEVGFGFVDFLIKPHYGRFYERLYYDFLLYAQKHKKDMYLIEEYGSIIVDGENIITVATNILK